MRAALREAAGRGTNTTMARALLIALALLLAACGRHDARAPFLDSQTPPSLATRFYPPEGWAWGTVRAGRLPAQRYGVASPAIVPRADVLITPGYGESAETWFETARDLIAAGANVWILDRAGQGGSGRFAGPRDVAHAPSFDADVAGLVAMRELVIRPRPERPFIILASRDGAVAALRALEGGMPADGVILSAPRLARGEHPELWARAAVRVGLGSLPAPGRRLWRRDGPDGVALKLTHDRWRGAVTGAWMLANPDLRVSGASVAWTAGHAKASEAAWNEAAAMHAPALMLLPDDADGDLERLCRRMPRCRVQRIEGARPALHLEADAVRKSWLAAVIGAVPGARAPVGRT